MDHRARRAGPLWKGGNVAPECGIIELVDEDAEKGDSLVTRVGLQLRVDLDDEGGSNSGKQASLFVD